MKNKIYLSVVLLTLLLLLCSCECKHKEVSQASCTNPSVCLDCQAIMADAVGHTWTEEVVTVASCDQEGLKLYNCATCKYSYSEKYSRPTYSADEVFELTKNCVGEITTYDKSGKDLALGTGFLISKDGELVTNYHVIEDSYSANIKINGTVYSIEYVLAYDKVLDLAILKIKANDFAPLSICKKEHHVGKSVYAFGSSQGLTSTFSQGIITSNREIDDVSYVQHDAAISSGNSGGPLIDQYGDVIGINTWTVKDSQNLNFAICASELSKLVYNTPLTFSDFYEKECDAFKKMKNYIMQEGSYNSSDDEYEIFLDYYSSDGYLATRKAYYDVDQDTITLYFLVDSNYLTALTINNEINGIYSWMYLDDNSYYMTGILIAGTYTDSTLLEYIDHNIYSSSLRSTVQGLASSMMSLLCTYFNEDFEDINVCLKDLGFSKYK